MPGFRVRARRATPAGAHQARGGPAGPAGVPRSNPRGRSRRPFAGRATPVARAPETPPRQRPKPGNCLPRRATRKRLALFDCRGGVSFGERATAFLCLGPLHEPFFLGGSQEPTCSQDLRATVLSDARQPPPVRCAHAPQTTVLLSGPKLTPRGVRQPPLSTAADAMKGGIGKASTDGGSTWGGAWRLEAYRSNAVHTGRCGGCFGNC